VQSITRLLVVALAAITVSTTAVGWRTPAPARWHAAPQHLERFVPVNHRRSYDIAVTPQPLDEVIAEIAADPNAAQTPGAWQPRNESPSDAFGIAADYNRWQLARLYGGRSARVARGARLDRGRVIESWTLISPYPSADLGTLHPGTMRLILTVAP
jgi:hypothetical protein